MHPQRRLMPAILAIASQSENGLQCRELKELPEDCPWHWAQGYTPQQVIEQNFAAVGSEMGGFVQYLLGACVDILVVSFSGRWWLVYDLGDPTRCFVGAEPEPEPHLSESALAAGWTLPPEMAVFAQIHNGFGVADIEEFALEMQFFGGHDMLFPAEQWMLPETFWPEGYLEELYKAQEDAWSAQPDLATQEARLADLLFLMTYADGNGVALIRGRMDADGAQVVEWRFEEPQSSTCGFFTFLQKKFDGYFLPSAG
ncbi:hypothetical protein L6R29_16765 [Myxococcota bacterium]|nr:hypothetical protein [Myxococcota bacterium]